jgi:superfamily II DNA or RNA helicase
LDAWTANGQRGILEVITGAGKTLVAEMAIIATRSKWPNATTVIVVPTVALADQWFVSLQDDLGLSETDLDVVSRRRGVRQDAFASIAVINTARDIPIEAWGAVPRLLVVDECHRAASPVNARALEIPAVSALGLSATPHRQYDSGYEDVLVPRIGPTVYSYTLEDGIRDGIVSPFDLVNVQVPLLAIEDQAYQELTRQIGRRASRGEAVDELQERLLRRRARLVNNSEARVPTVAAILERHRGARTLVFHESIDHANRIHGLLREKRHSVAMYHTGIGASPRRENLLLFRRGVFEVLVSCRALDEGVNVPEVEVAVVAAGTASLRQRIQRLGRVLRPAHGKQRATIYTLYSTPPEEQRLLDESRRLDLLAEVSWRRADMEYSRA